MCVDQSISKHTAAIVAATSSRRIWQFIGGLLFFAGLIQSGSCPRCYNACSTAHQSVIWPCYLGRLLPWRRLDHVSDTSLFSKRAATPLRRPDGAQQSIRQALMAGKRPTSSRGGRRYGENTLARKPELGRNRRGDWINRIGWLRSYDGRDS